MNRKIWKALGIAVCMLALAAPRAMAETIMHTVTADTDFAEVVKNINASGVKDENVIELCADITLTGNHILKRNTTIKSKDEDRKISIKGENAGITVAGEKTVLNLGAKDYDGTLTIAEDEEISGGSASGNAKNAFVSVLEGATANMYGNVTLQNWKSRGNACVVIMGSNSVFNMHGGVIEKCSRAVIAQSGATFNMSGGEIRNCGGGRGSGNGGGVRVYEATFVMSDGTISGCSADTGGGLCAEKSSTVTISGGTISGCTAENNGGGLYATNSSEITISDGTISGGTISGCSASNGGGLYADSSTVTIKGGTISGCTARNNGGGLYATNSSTNSSIVNISGGMISGCTARNNGGGLYATNSSTNSSIVNISGGTISGCTGVAGGGLYADNSIVTINNGTISRCKAGMGAGGGLYATSQSTININGGTIEDNEAAFSGGGLYVDGSTITIEDGTISGCTAAIKEGGGLYAENSSTITINKSTISECKAQAYNGGGLYANNSAINISDGTISGCEGRWGGGLYAENSSTITITDSTISGCKAGAGGGLCVVGSTLNIKDDIISKCFVSDTGKGGGLYAENSTLTISGGTIKGNKAAYGGGVALVKSKVKVEEPITNWTVVDNEAYKTDTGSGYIGGGIYLESGSMDVSNGSNKIYNNTADGHGADICLTDDTSSIKLPNAANMGAKYLDSGIYIDGWYNDDNPRYTPSESGVPVKVDGAEPLKGALSLVASYKAIPMRTVKIDTNGGVGGSGSQTVQKGTTVILEAPTKEGHLFKGWEDKEKGNRYPAGEDGKVHITVNENMKLTAVWEARTFTVTYVLLNGETRTETAAYGETVTLVEEPRTGYTFVGWNDGEKVYRAGETITVTGDVTLTAVWKAQSFTVTYVLLDGKTRTETAAYGENVALVEEPRTGYTFVGWKDGEKVHQAGETITVTGNVTLTAVWETQSFTVTYVLLDGKPRTETAAYGQNVTLVEEPRTGYTFVGWKDGEKMRQAGETLTVTGDMTLTAEWKKLPSAENLPKTGDESPVLLWGAALAVSAAACFVLRRKK